MKKLIALGAFAVLGVAALTSCKKDYTCTYTSNGVSTSQDYTGLNKAEAETAETQCQLLGGVWEKK